MAQEVVAFVFGEWSVLALDSGLYSQTKAKRDSSYPQCVPDQRIRASQAKHILADFFNHPSVVGAHWFTYSDMDSTTRQANRGLVRADGRAWELLVQELAKLHDRMSRATSAQSWPYGVSIADFNPAIAVTALNRRASNSFGANGR